MPDGAWKSPGQSRRAWAELGPALLFMLPAIILVAAFTYVPFIRAVSLSLFVVNRNTFRPSHFMGLAYYLRVLNIGGSPFGTLYLRSLLTTFTFTLMVVPLSIAAAVGLGLLAQARLRKIGIVRTIFTSTVAISVASASVIWSLIYSPNLGLFRGVLRAFHLNSTGLLTDSHTALAAVALMTIWTSLGFNFVVALAGLQTIPGELYESALIDGAGHGTTFRKLTLPLLGPTLLFLLVITTIACFQSFTQFKVLNDSVGPDQSTNVFVYAIFDAFWMQNDYGFASAMSVVLFVVILGLTISQLRLDRKVHYQ
jgi:sn-glycerol 3-phosphate transport system permease protein